jgi:hypothetical protein
MDRPGEGKAYLFTIQGKRWESRAIGRKTDPRPIDISGNKKAAVLFGNSRHLNLSWIKDYAFLSSFFLAGLHFSQTFFSFVAATQQGWEHSFAAAIALSQQVASVWHFSQTFFSARAETQHLWSQSLPAAFALTQQLSAIAPLVLSRKAAAQTATVNVLMNFIVIPLSSAQRLTWQPHPRKSFTATQPRARGIESLRIYRPPARCPQRF